MGDVVHALPVASALKACAEPTHVTWVVDRPFHPLVERCGAVDQAVARERDPRLWIQASRRLEPFALALDLQGLAKSAFVVASVRAKQRIGYHWQREGARLVSSPVLPDPSSTHVVDQYLDVARAAGAPEEPARWDFAPTADDTAAARALLQDRGWDGRPLVVMNAGAGWQSKRWSPAEFASLARMLCEAGLAVAFVGAKSERGVWDELAAESPGTALDLIGATTMGVLVGVVGICWGHVGGDTGTSHIAAAMGKPAWSIFPLTRPERSCPYGQRHRCFDTRREPVGAGAVAERVLAEAHR